MSLGLWGHLLVVSIGGSVVLLTLIVVICFVHPSCWGRRCLENESDKKKCYFNDAARLENGTIKKLEVRYWINEPEYVQSGNPRSEKPRWNDGKINLKCAPFSVTPMGAKDKLSEAKLRIKLSYKSLNSDNMMGRLTVHLMEARSLPYREYFNSLDPFVVLDILNNRWSLQKSERIVQSVQSRVVRHSYNPKFDQTFLFDVKKSDMKDWCLKFTLFDRDRLTKKNPICEKRIYIRDVKNLTLEPEVELVEDLQEVTTNYGQLLFGISYLPTAQRLSISIMKASSLKYLTIVPSLDKFYPYVRIFMLNAQGKCIKKKKTSFRQAEENPAFNETMTFDLPVSSLEQAVFLILLCSKVVEKKLSSNEGMLDMEIEHPTKENKDGVLGVVVMGKNVRCTKAREHWLTVMQNPRQIISVWHCLR